MNGYFYIVYVYFVFLGVVCDSLVGIDYIVSYCGVGYYVYVWGDID